MEKLPFFDFDTFEAELTGRQNLYSNNVFDLFAEVVESKRESGTISTAEKYQTTKRCLEDFRIWAKRNPAHLNFNEINQSFLESFSNYSEKIRGASIATITLNLRNLRCIYNIAVNRRIISREDYPFGKGKFSIRRSRKVNKALTKNDLEQLWKTIPLDEKQAAAKDFWFFSYYAFGANYKDILELRHSSVFEDSFTYVRAKTKFTKKDNVEKTVPINPIMAQIIERRKVQDSTYLFGVLNDHDTPKIRHGKIRQFCRTMNYHFRKFALSAGIKEEVAVKLDNYYARHTFCMTAIRSGQNIALISEVMHDGNLDTTRAYINSFAKEELRDLSNSLIF